jgi:hypothetical protein
MFDMNRHLFDCQTSVGIRFGSKQLELCFSLTVWQEAREFSFQGKFPAVKFTPERKFMPPLSGDIGRTKASDIPDIPIRGTIRGTVASLPRSHAR